MYRSNGFRTAEGASKMAAALVTVVLAVFAGAASAAEGAATGTINASQTPLPRHSDPVLASRAEVCAQYRLAKNSRPIVAAKADASFRRRCYI